ncbi:hypothetical protein ABZ806_37865 [Spirillospora sp. NPDC047418]
MSGHDLREWTTAQVRSAMTAAMRADPHALDRLAGANSAVLDPHSVAFLRTARMLTLATSAALTTVLTVHRAGRDRHERPVCAACGTGRCRTSPSRRPRTMNGAPPPGRPRRSTSR